MTYPQFIRRILNGLVRRYLAKDPSVAREFHPYLHWVDSEQKRRYDKIYAEGMRLTGTRTSVWRKDRFLNLYSIIGFIDSLDGDYAECGVWKGLSSYVICSAIKDIHPEFKGERYHVFDSFEGLSVPTASDAYLDYSYGGRYSCDIEQVKKNLDMFPRIEYYKGWIPEIFKDTKKRMYKFVHVDLDLADPVIGAVEYFLPHMVPGGIILCDDYGSDSWKGMTNGLYKLCVREKVRTIFLSTGQLILFKS